MKDESFIIYKDDNDSNVEAWVKNLTVADGFVTFLTSNNEITIPNHRVIKIKKRKSEENESKRVF